MGRSVHQLSQSPDLLWAKNSQRVRKSSKEKSEPTSKEIVRDYGQLLEDALRSFTKVVDRAFPNADFLLREHVQGSDIAKDTKLSFVLRACFGLSQMTLKPEIIENYRLTLKEFLKQAQHNPSDKVLYTDLLNIIHVYQSMSKATTAQQQIQGELFRLEALDLASKTIDRRLRMEWVAPAILKPIGELTSQIAKTMGSSDGRLTSGRLAGCSNSLAGLARLVEISNTAQQGKKRNHSEASPKIKGDEDQDHQYPMAAPAA